MADKKRLISVEKTVEELENEIYWTDSTKAAIRAFLRTVPAEDAVTVADIEAWLYEMAMNNIGSTLCEACEEIIRRLDGLRQFSKGRGTV